MDYQSEQEMEVEALEAILMDDLQEYNGTLPTGWTQHGKTYKVAILPSEEGGEPPPEGYDVRAELLFAHTPNYPEEAPSIKLRSVQGLSDADIAAGQKILEEEVENSLGMAMIFTLISTAREWLVTKTTESAAVIDPLAAQRAEEEAAERKRLAARAHGTPVTVETFAAWKASFAAEMALKKAQLAETEGKADGKGDRLTGRAWFMREAVSELGTEEGASSEEDEIDIDGSVVGSAVGREDEEEDDDFDVDDDDEEDVLDSYLARQQTS